MMNYTAIKSILMPYSFFVISRFHYLFNKSLEIKGILWEKINIMFQNRLLSWVVLVFLCEQIKCSWGITHISISV